MKMILLLAMITLSANAKWIYVKNADPLIIMNDDTGEIFEEFLGTMVRKRFTDDIKIIYNADGSAKQVLPSDDKRNTPAKK